MKSYKALIDQKSGKVTAVAEAKILKAKEKAKLEKARSDALFRGDRTDPHLSAAGRKLVDKLIKENKVELVGLRYNLKVSQENEVIAEKKIENLKIKLKELKALVKHLESIAEKAEARAYNFGSGNTFERQSFENLPPFFQHMRLEFEVTTAFI